jgi:L-alanine-DL-glutamate epimerase-like enolase superfamily enzyme
LSTLRHLTEFATGLRDVLIGRDPFDIEQLWNLMYRKSFYYGRQGPAIHAISGVDIVLWDIVGKAVANPFTSSWEAAIVALYVPTRAR